MMAFPLVRYLRTCAQLLFLAAALVGCKKQQDQQAHSAPPEAATPVTGEVVPPSSPASVADTGKALSAADEALKAKDYEKAAEALLAVQRQKQFTEQQAQAARNQMVRFQKELASAVASGNPKAKAAADLLRQAARHR